MCRVVKLLKISSTGWPKPCRDLDFMRMLRIGWFGGECAVENRADGLVVLESQVEGLKSSDALKRESVSKCAYHTAKRNEQDRYS